MTTRARVKSFIAATRLDGSSAQVSDEESLLDSGLIDSMAILELVVFIEEEFGLKVLDEEIIPENFETIAAITRFVEGKLRLGPKVR